MFFAKSYYLSTQDHKIAALVPGINVKTIHADDAILKISLIGTFTGIFGNNSLSVFASSILFIANRGGLIRETTVIDESQINKTIESSLTCLSEDFVTVLIIKPEPKSLTYTVQTAIKKLIQTSANLTLLIPFWVKLEVWIFGNLNMMLFPD